MVSTRFPFTRLRRGRMQAFARALLQETHLHPADFVFPVFILPGQNRLEPISSLPGIHRMSIDILCQQAKHWRSLGLQAINLYPVVPAEQKTDDAKAAYDPNGLLQNSLRALKDAVPDLGLITDVALDPFTPHGHDGLINEQAEVLNDLTVSTLVKQALSHAEAGADVVAPSDMMDGRIGAIRSALESAGFHHTLILAYTAKYHSALYGPFREAVGSGQTLAKKDKSTYQMNPANAQEAILEARQDIEEGADIIMVKPALAYLDIIKALTQTFSTPVFAFQVSGEYAMQKWAMETGLSPRSLMTESLLSIKRAGATAIHSYFAIEWLKLQNA